MIDNRKRRIHVGDKIYRVYWQPIDGKPVWSFIEYVIEDMFYSDNCYVIIRDTKCGLRSALKMNRSELIEWYYTEQEAKEACKKEQSAPQAYCWGDSTYRNNDKYAKSNVTGIPCIVETAADDSGIAHVEPNIDTEGNVYREPIKKDHFLVRLYNAIKSRKFNF